MKFHYPDKERYDQMSRIRARCAEIALDQLEKEMNSPDTRHWRNAQQASRMVQALNRDMPVPVDSDQDEESQHENEGASNVG
jgi:hypothetical protein